jgi:hypothetical protein
MNSGNIIPDGGFSPCKSVETNFSCACNLEVKILLENVGLVYGYVFCE